MRNTCCCMTSADSSVVLNEAAVSVRACQQVVSKSERRACVIVSPAVTAVLKRATLYLINTSGSLQSVTKSYINSGVKLCLPAYCHDINCKTL
eukprot:17820-Heterococcus_DN1.PRE.5